MRVNLNWLDRPTQQKYNEYWEAELPIWSFQIKLWLSVLFRVLNSQNSSNTLKTPYWANKKTDFLIINPRQFNQAHNFNSTFKHFISTTQQIHHFKKSSFKNRRFKINLNLKKLNRTEVSFKSMMNKKMFWTVVIRKLHF